MIVADSLMNTMQVCGDAVGISAVVAAMMGLSVLLLTGVLSWRDCLTYPPAWDTLFWFAVLVGVHSLVPPHHEQADRYSKIVSNRKIHRLETVCVVTVEVVVMQMPHWCLTGAGFSPWLHMDNFHCIDGHCEPEVADSTLPYELDRF